MKKTLNKKLSIHNQGVVLITAIFIVFLIATLGIGYLTLVNNQLEIADTASKSVLAFYCAETGISEVMAVLKTVPDWQTIAGVIIEGVLDKGTYLVEVNPLSHPTKDEITVKSTGKMSNFQRIIQVTLDKTSGLTIIKKDWKEI